MHRGEQGLAIMFRSSKPSKHNPKAREEPNWVSSSIRLSYFLPGLIIGFLLGLWVELPKGKVRRGSSQIQPNKSRSNSNDKKRGGQTMSSSVVNGEELKMVFVVRQDLKMGGGKIASQCAHAAVGIYDELIKSQRALLNQWEQCGQPKIVVTCKNQPEMNDLRAKAERAGLPTFTVADAGRTQVSAGSKTVLVIGPGDNSKFFPSKDADSCAMISRTMQYFVLHF